MALLLNFKFAPVWAQWLAFKISRASAVEIYLKQFVIFVVRVNLTYVALFVAFVDLGFGILSVPVRELF